MTRRRIRLCGSRSEIVIVCKGGGKLHIAQTQHNSPLMPSVRVSSCVCVYVCNSLRLPGGGKLMESATPVSQSVASESCSWLATQIAIAAAWRDNNPINIYMTVNIHMLYTIILYCKPTCILPLNCMSHAKWEFNSILFTLVLASFSACLFVVCVPRRLSCFVIFRNR